MNNVQLCGYTSLPQSSASYTITIPAENSSTTNNNNGKFKKIFH